LSVALIVEDGTGLSTAESYISVAAFKAYCDARGLTYGSDDTAIEQALRRATTWIDARYGARFRGFRITINQALVFPMSGLLDRAGYGVSYVPRQIAAATAEAAVREIAAPGSLSPDVTPGEVVKSMKAGSVQIEYASTGSDGRAQQPIIPLIDGILAPLLGNSSPYVGRAVRA
jgi:hypothetical protein